MGKRAFITGILGQDGPYLAELLLNKGYEVYGMMRRISVERFDNILHIMNHPKFRLVVGDLADQNCLNRLIKDIQPDEVYNLASQSHVGHSFDQPIFTGDVTGLGVTRMLEAIKLFKPDAKFYQASSSEMFGKAEEIPQTEKTPFHPRSPYAVAKVYGHWITVNYRESYNMFCCSGMLFNHEGPRRGIEFVTRKITDAAARIKLGKLDKIGLGTLDTQRDWGFAGDYCINLDIPILTVRGWKFYDDIREGDEIINFDPKTNKLARDKVRRKILLESEGAKILFEGRGVHLNVTPNHRIYYQKKYGCQRGWYPEWQVTTAEEFHDLLVNKSKRTKYDYRLPHFQNYDAPELMSRTDDELYFIGALLAEGHLQRIPPGMGISISISQSGIANPQTHDKLQQIMKRLNLQYRLSNRRDGITEWCFTAESSRQILSWFDSNDIHVFPEYLWQANRRQLEIIFNALMDCDGCWGNMYYISKRYKLAVDFQTIAHLIGRQTTGVKQRKTEGCYEVCVVTQRKPYTYIQNTKKYNDGHRQVWCVQTEHGTIITRDKECISISGNCEAMWLMLQQDKPDDYVIATGEPHTVREFCKVAFDMVGLDYQQYVYIDPRYARPADVYILSGDASKAKKVLGWEPKVKFQRLVEMMVEADLEKHKGGKQ